MKYVIILIAISFLMACQKEQFQPCENYDKLVGTWRSIDGDAVDYIEFTEDGKCKYISALERSVQFKLGYCEKKSTTLTYPGVNLVGYFLLDISGKEKGAITADFNTTFDTILGGSGAFNNNQANSYSDYYRRYVKM